MRKTVCTQNSVLPDQWARIYKLSYWDLYWNSCSMHAVSLSALESWPHFQTVFRCLWRITHFPPPASSRDFANCKNCFVLWRAFGSLRGMTLPRWPACQIFSCLKTSLGSSYDESTKKGHVLGRPGQFPLLHKENKSLKKSERELPSGRSPVFLHVASNPDCQVSRGLPVLAKAGRQCLVPNAELRRDTNEVGICRLASTCAFTSAIGWLKGGSAFQQCKFEQINSLPYCCGLFRNFLKMLQYIQLKTIQ